MVMTLDEFGRHYRSTFASLVDSKIVVALSGGADSVALLHLLHATDTGLTLLAVHIHHRTRGLEADDDASFCERLCAELSIPFVLHRLPRLHSGPEGREATWRRARYTALKEIASNWGADAIATGHQRDDVAEGVLVQLLRGAGPRAMAGIAASQGELIRPLLPWSHLDLCTWLEEHNIRWREDSSNRSTDHLRNQVRHELLPLLERSSPALRRHLVRFAAALAADEEFMAGELEDKNLWIDVWHPNGGVPLEALRALAPALRVRWLHSQAARSGIGRVTHRQGEHLNELLAGDRSALTLARRWSLRRASDRLWLEPPILPPAFEFTLKPNQRADLPLPGWTTVFRPVKNEPGENGWYIPVPENANPIVRSPQAQDRLPNDQPVGSLFRRQLPRHLRNSWPIFVIDDKMMWVPGMGIDIGLTNGNWMIEVTRK